MNKIKSFFDFGLDFLFPADETVERIRDIPSSSLANILEASEDNIEGTSTLFKYSDERVKHLVWEIKYHKNEKIAETSAVLMAEQVKKYVEMRHPANEPIEKWRSGKYDPFLVVSIPQTSRRFRERGFNHTKIIAELVVKHLPANFILVDNILKKIRHTPKQSSIENREERFTNIVGAFAVVESPAPTPIPVGRWSKIVGKNIILIDDVITTGATIGEARRVLLDAGAKSVFAFGIAH